MGKHTFNYLDISTVEGGWVELFNELPDWITELRKKPYEPLEKEIELQMIRDGNKDAVIKANLRFVTNIARHYIVEDLDVWELISSGNEGLILALDKFDPERDVKFITYAVNLIRAKMIETLNENNTINLSVKAIRLLSDFSFYGDIQTMKDKLEHRYPQSVSKLEEKINKYLEMKWVASLDDQFDDGTSRSDGVAGKTTTNHKDKVLSLLEASDLTGDEIFVISSMFALYEDKPMSSREIGDELGVSKDTIRRIKLKAFAKLKEIDELKDIMNFINDEQSAVTWAFPTTYSSHD